MKTDPTRQAEPDESERDSPFDALLHKPAAEPPTRIAGIVIARLESVSAEHGPQVFIAPLQRSVTARSLVALGAEHVGQALAVAFEQDDPTRPLVLGRLYDGHGAPAACAQTLAPGLLVRREDERVVIEADTCLELRCGDTVIALQADGQVHIRGDYITSHATAGQRIRGGAVQIN